MMEQILSTLGLALRAGSVAVGEEPVGSAARAKHARLILVASDAAPGSVRRAFAFAQTGACLCLVIPAEKAALGRALGRTSCAMCAVTDIGFAQSLVKKLAAADGETYGAASQALDIKAKRARERTEEQVQHEKNLWQGKRRVHAAKPPEEPAHPPEGRPEPERRPPRRADRPDRVYKERSSRDAKSRRPHRKEAPGQRYENALPVKKGKGSRKPSGK